MDEFERIAALRQLFSGPAPGLALGIGDDAAVLERPAGPLVISVDAAVEGVHFKREFAPMHVLGRRASVAALSDLAAMGARPIGMLANLQLPAADMSDDELLDLARGQAAAAQEYAAPMVGGNLCTGLELAITTTVLGVVEMGAPLQRGSAQVGDTVYVSGPVGGAAIGLQLCLQGRQHDEGAAPFVDAYLHPMAHIDMGLRLIGVATACVDVSDGLVQDLAHLCQASDVGAEVWLDRVPGLAGMTPAAQSVGLDAVHCRLTGGDDYVLVFTAPDNTRIPGTTPIGRIVGGRVGVQVLDQDGRPFDAPLEGFRHR